jgi:hypothetical protein
LPGAIPETIPVDEPTEASAVLLQDQTPPGVELVIVVLAPVQSVAEPTLGDNDITVMV